MKEIPWQKWASIGICLAVGAGIIWIFFRYILSLLLPFLLAWLLSLIIHPLAESLSKRFHLSKKLLSVILFLGVLTGLSFLLGFSIRRLFLEVKRLLNRLLESGNLAGGNLFQMQTLMENLGLVQLQNLSRNSEIAEEVDSMVSDIFWKLLSSLSSKLPQIAGKIISSMPSVFLFTVVTVISGFYFCLERKEIENRLISRLPQKIRERIPTLQGHIKRFSWRYVRAYLLLLLLTFTELFLGFSILRVEYAFLLSLIIAIVDLLPVLGVGTVLIPWGVIELLRKDFYLGFGLLILYVAMTVLRQVLEPKLVGKSLGLHPLLTLVFGYVGWNLFGFLGMALGPILAFFLKSVFVQVQSAKKERPQT